MTDVPRDARAFVLSCHPAARVWLVGKIDEPNWYAVRAGRWNELGSGKTPALAWRDAAEGIVGTKRPQVQQTFREMVDWATDQVARSMLVPKELLE